MGRSGRIALVVIFSLVPTVGAADGQSVARQWNEALLDAIRVDNPRPTVHARNLFHVSLAMYDAWAAYDDVADTYLLGKTVDGYACPFDGVPAPADVEAAREEAISYAAYRLLTHRFGSSPGAEESLGNFRSLLATLGYDPSFTSTDYSTGSPAALGNYMGQCLIDLGLQDGSNEEINYAYRHYKPVNPPMYPALAGDSTILNLNHWQPLSFIATDGSTVATPKFLCPEWCWVCPFALTEQDRTAHVRDGLEYWVYHDPGKPPCLCTPPTEDPLAEGYRWNFALAAIWSSHLDPSDGVLWDISPASMGNLQTLPRTAEELRECYDLFDGGDPGTGRTVNPRTGKPYEPQIVPRGDYTRVLAEFWADGPNSETPPGHWFTILNYVSDHPAFVKRFRGTGPVLDPLEWDVKAYLALGGAVHDAAVATWSIKGWYDYVRPISAIRGMAERGQASDQTLANYDSAGIPLMDGYIELIRAGDPLAGTEGENVGKIKLRAWRGPDFYRRRRDRRGRSRLDPGRELVAVPETDLRHAGVRGLCLGPLDLLPCGGRGADAPDRRRVLSRRLGRISRPAEPVPGLRRRPQRGCDPAMGDLPGRRGSVRLVADLGRHSRPDRRHSGPDHRRQGRRRRVPLRRTLLPRSDQNDSLGELTSSPVRIKKAPPSERGLAMFTSDVPLAGNDIRRARAFLALPDVELHSLILFQRGVALRLDLRVMNEQILPAIIRSNKPKALARVEPLYFTSCHNTLLRPDSGLQTYFPSFVAQRGKLRGRKAYTSTKPLVYRLFFNMSTQ